ncbi:hypothetical protein D9756_005042 [Leucocoprinus leucothites]|uniref:Uncharacterized protein n=1 Tax=Leucocoprinus leucothites TaxID=201217 RepID=A0A8H5LKL1_9AGAR|nr:hypothetical protein D9756_005042 [Leucoagaricus leucothites]
MQSGTGDQRAYNAQDQRPPKLTGPQKGEYEKRERFEHGPGPAHLDLDSKDQRTLANKLSAAEKHELQLDENSRTVHDPLKPAMDHGNKPSRGAQIDAELQREDEEMLRKKSD